MNENTGPHSPKESSRRTFLINPDFQFKMIRYFTLIAIGVMVINFGATSFYFKEFRDFALSTQMTPHDSEMLLDFVAKQKQQEFIFFMIRMALIVGFVGIVGLVVTNRIAGPIYRLTKHLKSVAKGETTADLRFRDGDFFKEVETTFNEHMRVYRQKISDPETTRTSEVLPFRKSA